MAWHGMEKHSRYCLPSSSFLYVVSSAIITLTFFSCVSEVIVEFRYTHSQCYATLRFVRVHEIQNCFFSSFHCGCTALDSSIQLTYFVKISSTQHICPCVSALFLCLFCSFAPEECVCECGKETEMEKEMLQLAESRNKTEIN